MSVAARPARMLAAYVAGAVGVAAPGLLIRLAGYAVPSAVGAALFAASLVAAGFILSWSAEAGERRIGQALVVVLLALITVLPEYAVDIYFAFHAGSRPQYAQFAAANMTGANRLLVGAAWPLIVVLAWWRSGSRGIELGGSNRIEILFLGIASAYAFVILAKDRIDLIDCAALIAIFAAYMWRASRGDARGQGSEDDDEDEGGPSGALLSLPHRTQLYAMAGMMMLAGAIVLLMAEPFAEAMVATGKAMGINQFLLIQWIAPLASETPTITLAAMLVWAGSARTSLGMMLSDKINQWTLLVSMLPLAMSVGARSVSALPLDARQHEEFFLTAAQSLFALSLLLGMRFGRTAAAAIFVLFALQVGLAVVYRNDEAQTIVHLTQLGWVYLALAAIVILARPRLLLKFLLGLRGAEERT